MIARLTQTLLVGVCLPVCLFCDLMVYGVGGAVHGSLVALDWAWGYTAPRPNYFWSVPPTTVKWWHRLKALWVGS